MPPGVRSAQECFSEKARAAAADADIVITNHAMLAISAFEGLAVLPEYDVVVIDEAHELHDRVTGAVSGQLSASMVSAAATALRRHASISARAARHRGRRLRGGRGGRSPRACCPAASPRTSEQALAQVRDACRAALSDTKTDGKSEADVDGGRQVARSRATPGLRARRADPRCTPAGRGGVGVASQHLHPGSGYSQPDDGAPATFNVAPLSVAGRLREGLFEDHTVILTSATLAIGSEFGPVAGFARAGGRASARLDRRRRRQPVRLPEAGRPVRGEGPAQA